MDSESRTMEDMSEKLKRLRKGAMGGATWARPKNQASKIVNPTSDIKVFEDYDSTYQEIVKQWDGYD